jgi:hypothetical protein
MDNIKMDLLEIGVNVVDWIGLAQDRYRWRALVNSVMNVRFEVFTAVTMKNGVFWVVTPCGSSETTVLTRATRRNNPEDTILR